MTEIKQRECRPPPYQDVSQQKQQDEDTVLRSQQDAFFTSLVQLRSNDEQTPQSPVVVAETDRLRGFLRFCMSVDYQECSKVALLAVDQAHYATLRAIYTDLTSTACITASEAERAALAPYFWHTLQQPSAALRIPVELAIKYIERFFTYQTNMGRYKGCLEGIAFRGHIDLLAIKFVTDREIMIPALFSDLTERANMFRKCKLRSDEWFEDLYGATSVTSTGNLLPPALETTMFPHRLVPWYNTVHYTYKLTPRAQKWLENKDACIKRGQDGSSPQQQLATWTQQAKAAVRRLLSALPLVSQSAQDHVKGPIFRTETPNGYMWMGTYHMPDWFSADHRPHSTTG